MSMYEGECIYRVGGESDIREGQRGHLRLAHLRERVGGCCTPGAELDEAKELRRLAWRCKKIATRVSACLVS